ncbi:hypothetical protein TVAG_046500 [Trichomonas vaginalis G3]|uniref:Ubiquitin-like domain-containing protein n=1 Tax=Trichomonas vaginalis (strain ATCC PRA-98 / G3) TaxID=412133 RepID=A2DML9_TRIV3|nr:ubiquitin-like family [Trichomonas vaginalis G3]EAY18446.1 hypothetical protein TVAG_046500 [Trichomonas vaginalis G3]KAI5530275.1 ubiquitin-like family [Trichomonas vaginalis G3]|eukprot:XP_001579432.1 hypothetical protein [Trichomonas vaginalis G3]
MQVYIHTHDNQIHHRVFSHNDPIQLVRDTVSCQTPSVLLYNNTVLVPTMPFGFYNIQNGSHIFIIPKINTQPAEPRRQPQFSPKAIEDIKREAERIKDVMYSKIDNTPQYFGKIVKRFNGIKRTEKLEEQKVSLVVPSQLSKPSDCALPKFW